MQLYQQADSSAAASETKAALHFDHADRHQALVALKDAVGKFAELKDGRRIAFFRLTRIFAKCVVAGSLTEGEVRAALYDGARANGAFATSGERWLDKTLDSAIVRAEHVPPPRQVSEEGCRA